MRLFTLLILLITMRESTVVVGAQTRREIPSPDKQFLAILEADLPTSAKLTIQDTTGHVMFTSEACLQMQNALGFDFGEADGVHWSPDSSVFATSVCYGKVKLSYAIVHQNKAFVLVPILDVTDKYDNPYVIPIKWLSGRRLILDISGPHAGHPGYYYSGRATIKITTNPPGCSILYKHIDEHKIDEEG